MNRALFLHTALLLVTLAADAADPLAFSDPANTSPPPAHAIGFPSRDANLDALPGFKNPPPGYGEVAFYWWLGDPLTKERLAWQIEQLAKVKGVMGLQINYAHSDRGGQKLRADVSERAAAVLEGVVGPGRLVHAGGEASRHGGQSQRLHARHRPGLERGRDIAAHPELSGMVLRMEPRRQGRAGDRADVAQPAASDVWEALRGKVLRPVRAAQPRRRRQGA